MRGWRKPYPVLIAATAIALIPMALLVVAMSIPVPPGCFEYCTLGQEFAAMVFRFVGVLWLLAVLIEASSWQEREPSVAAVSAMVASALLLVVAVRLYGIVSYETLNADFYLLAWVLALGLQLPPVWRLARRARPSLQLRVVVGAMGVAVVVAGLAVVFLGTKVTAMGGSVVALAWMANVVCMLLIAIAAWKDGASSPSLVGPLLGASLPILVLPLAFMSPGDLGYVVFLAVPLTALTWLWVAVAWLRGMGPPPAVSGPSG